jgi:hypothetical protein
VPAEGKPTGKRRLAVLLLSVLLMSSVYRSREVWTLWLGQSLVCPETMARSELILVENFDPDYLVYARAAELQLAGFATRVLITLPVSTQAGQLDKRPYAMSKGLAELLSGLVQIDRPTFLPIQTIEPISLNAAYQLRDYLLQANLRSVIVVTPVFRSQRSALVYQAVLAPAGIRVHCVPAAGWNTARNWTTSWHDIQEVAEQFLKLLLYRFYVLRHPLA